jgi:hypothetical protein
VKEFELFREFFEQDRLTRQSFCTPQEVEFSKRHA